MSPDAALLHTADMVVPDTYIADDTAYLAALWDEPVVYVTQFAQALNSVTAGYFLSCYVSLYGHDEWAALNEDIVHKQTGLGRGRWYAVRDTLLTAGVLENRRDTGVSLYRLNGECLEKMVRNNAALRLSDIASPPVSLNRLHLRTLLHFGLSFKAALYLAVVQSETPHRSLSGRETWSDWVLLPEKNVSERSFLSKAEQRRAGEALCGIGVLEYGYGGFPRMRRCRYSLNRLAVLTTAYMQALAV
ncbi:hypothetical protein [Neisseria sp. 27098_8_139]|uniref:hypothetical protein n=1 Tax=Neisseria sp. 27098_8_139 TaxID=3003681 RepID=UPI00352F4C8B